jgi:Na+-driven multidrug efflux pump
MRTAMLQSVLVYLVALAVLVPWLGNHGLWAALMVLNMTRAVTLLRLYPRIEARAEEQGNSPEFPPKIQEQDRRSGGGIFE